MLEQGVMTWLRAEARTQTVVVNVQQTTLPVLAADPDRFALLLRTDSGSGILYSLTNTANDTSQIYLPANGPTVILSADQVGQLVTYAVAALAITGTVGVTVSAVSYIAHRKRIYDKLIRQYLSQHGTL